VNKICEHCQRSYQQCKSCEETYSKIYYTWRTHFCSPSCMFEEMSLLEKGDKLMRVQFNGKTFTLKSFNLDKDEFVMPDNTKLKAKELEGFILDTNTMQEIIGKRTDKTKVKKEEVKKETPKEEIIGE